MMEKRIANQPMHKMQVEPRRVTTACGIRLIAAYPQFHSALALLHNQVLNCTDDAALVDCPECLRPL